MLANLGVKSGMAICDMGCGNGFHTLQLAEMTGKNGYVAGVDVQPQMLMLLRNRLEENGLENVIPILGSYHNPRLPRASMDLISLGRCISRVFSSRANVDCDAREFEAQTD